MNKFLEKDSSGNWSTIPPVPVEKIGNVNCHKFVLYAIGKISWDEMISDPTAQKQSGTDFTYGEKARTLSNKKFVTVADKDSLVRLASESCDYNNVCVGQIKDTKTGEMAHSFIVEKKSDGNYQCYDKQGFKDYPFSIHSLESLLEFVNEKGEKSYQNQEWRFFSNSKNE